MDKGSTFTVYLPVNRERFEEKGNETEITTESQEAQRTNSTDISNKRSDVTIMLVEDNEDFRFLRGNALAIDRPGQNCADLDRPVP